MIICLVAITLDILPRNYVDERVRFLKHIIAPSYIRVCGRGGAWVELVREVQQPE